MSAPTRREVLSALIGATALTSDTEKEKKPEAGDADSRLERVWAFRRVDSTHQCHVQEIDSDSVSLPLLCSLEIESDIRGNGGAEFKELEATGFFVQCCQPVRRVYPDEPTPDGGIHLEVSKQIARSLTTYVAGEPMGAGSMKTLRVPGWHAVEPWADLGRSVHLRVGSVHLARTVLTHVGEIEKRPDGSLLLHRVGFIFTSTSVDSPSCRRPPVTVVLDEELASKKLGGYSLQLCYTDADGKKQVITTPRYEGMTIQRVLSQSPGDLECLLRRLVTDLRGGDPFGVRERPVQG